MKHFNFIPAFNLQLFADGGAAAGGDGGTAQGQGVTAGAASQQTKGDLANVKYGIQPEEAAPAAEVQTPTADRNAQFEALIKGEYKAEFDARVKQILDRRFKAEKKLIIKFLGLMYPTENFSRRTDVALLEYMEELSILYKNYK